MKEFNTLFDIQFDFRGQTIKKRIELSDISVLGDTWFYYFDTTIDSIDYTFEVFGTCDDDREIRTSGPCIVDGQSSLPAFGINVSIDGDIIEQVDDIDIAFAD